METNEDQHILYHYFREKFVLPVRLRLYRVLRGLLIFFVLALMANFLFSYFFYTPKMWALRQQNNELVLKYDRLNEMIDSETAKLDEIRHRDKAVYHSIFSLDTLEIPGVWHDYPDTKYTEATYARYTPLMQSAWHKLDALTRLIYAQSRSFDGIETLSKDKDMMAECIPAIWPMNKNLLRNQIGAFGSRVDPFTGRWSGHAGIDLAGPHGSPIYATAMGVVIPSQGYGYGLQVMIDHGFGYKTRYAHLSRINVNPGQVVKRGEIIGEMGSTGRSTGTHLHYEVIYRGTPMNPLNYFSRDMSAEEFRDIISRAKETIYESK